MVSFLFPPLVVVLHRLRFVVRGPDCDLLRVVSLIPRVVFSGMLPFRHDRSCFETSPIMVEVSQILPKSPRIAIFRN